MAVKKTLDEVITLFTKRHNNKYDYSKVEYINSKTKVCIICPEHGEFWQTPHKHLSGQGCPKCGGKKKLTHKEAVERAKKTHNNKYNYDKFIYVNTDTKACIICPIHGEFWQTPHEHLSGQGCPKCYGNVRKTTETYIKEAKIVHGDRYIYDKTIYNNAYTKLIIGCPKHGDFIMTARQHLYGHGCPVCSGKKKYNRDYFLIRAKEVHGDVYDYSLIKEEDIKNNRTKVPIICKKHGIFYQTIDNHINRNNGCPKCCRSKLEEEIAKFLDEHNILYREKEKYEWLGKRQHIDFYLPEYNIAIECQGEQHFKGSNFGSKKITNEEAFKKVIKLDKNKKEQCKINGIKLLYFTNIILDEYPYEVITDYQSLLNELKKIE